MSIWMLSNLHGVDLKKCLVQPEGYGLLEHFSDTGPNKGKNLDMWIVLEEEPGSNTGYLIVFDDKRPNMDLADLELAICHQGYLGQFVLEDPLGQECETAHLTDTTASI